MTKTMACLVCGEAADDGNSQLCNNCDGRFHLRLRDGDDGKDCGEVWINEQYLSLEFACFTCLGVGPRNQEEPPVGTGH